MHAEIVLLDFGCVHSLPEEARVRLCNLVLACVERRSAEVQKIASAMAGPLHRFLPLLLSPSFALPGFFDGWLSTADLRAALRREIPASVSLEQVGQCVAGMHSQGGNILGVLHSMGYTRGLLSAIGFPERRRLQSMARFSVLGLLPDAQRALALGQRQGPGSLPPAIARRMRHAARQVDVSTTMLVTVIAVFAGTRIMAGVILVASLVYVVVSVLALLRLLPGLVPATEGRRYLGALLSLPMSLRGRGPSWGLRGGRREP